MGRGRDSTSDQKGLLRTWPEEGPKVLWTAPVGAGFGGPAVRDGQVYLLDRDEEVGDNLRVFDLASGKELWTFAYGAPGTFMFAGSRTTPTVDGEHVYTNGPMGDLYAINTKTRKPVWQKNIWKDFGGGELPRWAIVQNPLIYGNLLIVAPQTSQAGVVAYDKLTGELKWKSAPLSGPPGLRQPADHQGRRRGSPRHDHGERRPRPHREGRQRQRSRPAHRQSAVEVQGWQCAIPVPQPVDAGAGPHARDGRIWRRFRDVQGREEGRRSYDVKELFKNPDFGAHTQPPVLYKDHFYSHFTVNERSDGLAAMSLDGQVKWKTDQQPAFVRGGTILADGLLLTTDGNTKLYLVEPDPSGFKPIASVEILEPGDNWAPLALIDGKLLVRGQKQLKCLQVAQ